MDLGFAERLWVRRPSQFVALALHACLVRKKVVSPLVIAMVMLSVADVGYGVTRIPVLNFSARLRALQLYFRDL